MLVGQTKTGFNYEIDERAVTDWRFVKLVPAIENGTEYEQAAALLDVEKMLFKDSGKALEAHIASLNDGFVPSDALMEEVIEILTSDDEIKK